MKKIILISLVGFFTIFVGVAVAQEITFVAAQNMASDVIVSVPDIAVNKSPILKSLQHGTLKKNVLIHYANGKVEFQAKTSSCYNLLGVKWNSFPVNYVVNSEVEQIVPGAILASNETWDVVTSKELFNNQYAVDDTANWDDDYPDGRNEYSMGNYPQQEVIAVTAVWSGIPIKGGKRQIIEFDVMFDTDFTWGDATVNPTVMDLQNIAVHESGHGIGLGDIYSSNCSEVSMYGYSNYGETKKRTLERSDILGLQKMYGF